MGNEEEEKGNLSKEARSGSGTNGTTTKGKGTKRRIMQKKKRDAANLQLAIKKLIADEIKRKAEEAAKAEAAMATKTTEKKSQPTRPKMLRK